MKNARKKNKFPPGWDEKKARGVMEHYENRTEDEAAEEDESALKHPSAAVMSVPRELVPVVRSLIALSKG